MELVSVGLCHGYIRRRIYRCVSRLAITTFQKVNEICQDSGRFDES